MPAELYLVTTSCSDPVLDEEVAQIAEYGRAGKLKTATPEDLRKSGEAFDHAHNPDFVRRVSLLTPPEQGAVMARFSNALAGFNAGNYKKALAYHISQGNPESRIAEFDEEGRLKIQTNNRPVRDIVDDAMRALRVKNDPPVLYTRSSAMAMIGEENDRPAIVAVSMDYLHARLEAAANWVTCGKDNDIPAPSPIEVVRNIMSQPASTWNFPRIEGIVEIPTLRADGSILDVEGYDAASKLFYKPGDAVKDMDPIRPGPFLSDEVDAAVAAIREVVCDFPFLDDGSVANYIGLLLTPIMRGAYTGPTPLALIDATIAGSGKTLLTDVWSAITSGRPAEMLGLSKDDTELDKTIGSCLSAGGNQVVFDNVVGSIGHPALARALTTMDFKTRILGVSKMMTPKNRATWIANGNQLHPTGDMPRRCYAIRIRAKSARPSAGREFKHDPLLPWCLENRHVLLRALLVIASHWYRQGCPPVGGTCSIGSFEGWWRTIGGALKAAGVEGFLSNLEAYLGEVNDGDLQWERFLMQVSESYPIRDVDSKGRDGGWFSPADIVQATASRGTGDIASGIALPDSLADVADVRNPRMTERAIGSSFMKRIGRRYGKEEFQLQRWIDDKTRLAMWRVMTLEMEPAEPVQETLGVENVDELQ